MSSAPSTSTTSAAVDLRVAALVGLAAGGLGGLFGVGGGLIIVPGLIGLAKMDRRLAHGTSLAATLPIAVASLLTYASHRNVDWAVAVFLAVGAVAGAVLGTHLLSVIPKRPLTIIFVITVLATALRLFIAPETSGRGDLTAPMAVVLVVIGVATGTVAGLLGVGGGVIMVPALVVGLGVVPVMAKGTSVAVIVPTSVMGTFRNRRHANVDLRVAAVVGLAGVVSAVVGGTLADRIGDQVSNVMFAVLLLVVAVLQLASLRERPAAT